VLGRPGFLPAPGFALRIALGEIADSLLEGQRAVPSRLLELGYVFRWPDLEPALRNLLD
jgi:NAD dependent epimerase/dehydratase family enzyme